MKAITNRPMAHEAFKKFRSPRDGGIDLRVLNAAFFGKCQREKARETGLVDRTIPTQSTMNFTAIRDFPGEAVSPRSRATLPHGNLNGILANCRENIHITSGEIVFGKEDTVIAVAPTDQTAVIQTDLQIGLGKLCRVNVIANQRMMFFLTRRQQRQSLVTKFPQSFCSSKRATAWSRIRLDF